MLPKVLGSTAVLAFTVALGVAMTGDTTKSPLSKNGWGDGSPQNTNVLYSDRHLYPNYLGPLASDGS